MAGASLVVILLLLGALYVHYHLGPRPRTGAAEDSLGEGESGVGPAMSHPARPAPRPTPATYTRSGRSGDLLRASRSDGLPHRPTTARARVEHAARVLATPGGDRG